MATPGVLQSYQSSNNISQAGTYLDEANRTRQTGYARTDAGLAQTRLTDEFTQRLMPQFKSATAARGQYYSSARQKGEGFATKDYLNSTFDIQSALQRKLDDFEQQRLYASVGMIPV